MWGQTGLTLPARWREIKDIGRDGELQREEKLMRRCGNAVPTMAVPAAMATREDTNKDCRVFLRLQRMFIVAGVIRRNLWMSNKFIWQTKAVTSQKGWDTHTF